jgi:hypothetical protein
MNPRIQELVGQAKFAAEETLNKQISKNAELDAFAEKFAELIVRECAELTLSHRNDDYYNGWLDYRDEIRRHFGVES